MFCNKCGNENNDDSKFCSKCGESLTGSSVQYEYKSENLEPDKNKLTLGNIVLLVVVTLFVIKCASNLKNSPSSDSPSEVSQREPNSNHVSSDVSITQSQADAVVKLIQAYGFSCNSLSSAIQSSYDGSFSVTCNNWQYRYDIADIGGNWVVTVD